MKQAKYFFEWIYTDHNLLKIADIHPGYFALILVLFLSTVINGEFLEALRKSRIIFFLVVSALLLFLVETSSRMGFAALFLILALSLFRKRGTKEKWIYAVVFFTLFFILLKFDYLTSKFQKLVDADGNIVFERYFRWKEILNVFLSKGNIFFGEGTGDVYGIYHQAYANGNFKQALVENYNAHNEYLELLVGNGVLGLFIYLATLAHFVVTTKLRGAAMAFLILIAMFSFTESFLVRSKGVMIFAFFYPLLVNYYSQYDEQG
ncbi:MAG: O-antigen ligase family protein [Allomuricauda sp.]